MHSEPYKAFGSPLYYEPAGRQPSADREKMRYTPFMQHLALGIDIGKSFNVVSWSDGSRDRARWPTLRLSYDTPDWWKALVALIAPGCVIVAEPTGWHYLSPVAAVVTQMTQGVLWIAAPDAVVSARNHFAAAKTDDMDARALAYIAELVRLGDPPRNVRPHEAGQEASVLTLRLHVNQYARLTKAATRTQNQILVFGHSLWPELARRKRTWLALVERGAITPREVKAFAVAAAATMPDGMTGNNLRYIDSLASSLPDIEANPIVAGTIYQLATDLRALDDQAAATSAIVASLVHQHPFAEVTRRWLTIPRANPALIAPFHVATHGHADQFSPDAFKAVVGINPLARASGSTDRTKQSRKGYRPALNALWMWALLLVNPKAPANPVRTYYEGLKAANHPHAFTATRNKLARIICAVAADPRGYHYEVNQAIPPASDEVHEEDTEP